MRSGITRSCKECGKDIYVKKCLIPRKFFCSKTCMYKSRKGVPSGRDSKVDKTCRTCNKVFKVIRCLSHKRFSCSKECYSKYQLGKPNFSNSKFIKGAAPWNKGTKGVMKPNAGSFKCGSDHRHFKGSHIHKGYRLLFMPEHPFSCKNSYVREHKIVVEGIIGRHLSPKEEVHHINRIRNDNRPENLMAFSTKSAHRNFEEGNRIDESHIIFDGRYYINK